MLPPQHKHAALYCSYWSQWVSFQYDRARIFINLPQNRRIFFNFKTRFCFSIPSRNNAPKAFFPIRENYEARFIICPIYKRWIMITGLETTFLCVSRVPVCFFLFYDYVLALFTVLLKFQLTALCLSSFRCDLIFMIRCDKQTDSKTIKYEKQLNIWKLKSCDVYMSI